RPRSRATFRALQRRVADQQACDVIEKKKTELLAAREEIAKLKHLVNQLPETSAKSVNSTSIGFPHD
ncbi:MAG: hypothetical protein V4563_17985, partial [Pseudomonadota bacterium]